MAGKAQTLIVSIAIVLILLTPVAAQPGPCAHASTLTDLLKQAGLENSRAVRHAELLEQKHVNPSILKKITASQIQSLGIQPFADALKIYLFFSEDPVEDNCAAIKNPCNGGTCHDGYKCFKCVCKEGNNDPRCEPPCPCQNGECTKSADGTVCDCLPGFSGTLCDTKWLTLDRFLALEQANDQLRMTLKETQEQLASAKDKLSKVETNVEMVRTEASQSKFRIKRLDVPFPALNKISLHKVTPTYTNRVPVPIPDTTKAIIISVLSAFRTHNGHNHLDFDAWQKGNEASGILRTFNRRRSMAGNLFYQEYFLPWNSTLGDAVIFKIRLSFNSGGPKNNFRVSLAGFLET